MKFQRLVICLVIALFLVPPKAASGSGFMLVNSGHSSLYCIENKSLTVNTRISNRIAATEISQVFRNPTGARLEVFFCFPVPKGSVLSNFRMTIDGKEMKAELLDAAKAKGIYEEIVRKQRDPALLEYVGMDLFKVRIFPFDPNTEKTLKISYTSLTEKDGGIYAYTLPLNTQKHSAAPLKNVTINISISQDEKLKSIYSASHTVKITRENDKKALVSFEAVNTKPERDFTLYFNTDRAAIGVSMLNYREEGEDGIFLMDIAPGIELSQKDLDKDITFVLDVSGSMAGTKMEQARKALKFCINQLKPGDCFDVISFSTEARSVFKNLEVATKDNIKKAEKEIDAFEAIGGTNIDEALQIALKQGQSDRPHFIVFITDGKPTIGETDDKRLVQLVKDRNKSNKRIFTLGVGYDLNTHLLDEITLLTRSYRTYIEPEEDLEIKISDFYTKISSPVLTDLEVKVEGSADIYKTFPRALPDLFRGSSVNLLGRYKGDGDAKLILNGKVNGKPVSYTYPLVFEKKNTSLSYLPSLWANRYIGYMLDEVRLRGESQELRDEITALAKKYGIITPYTSYLIIEDESRLVSNNTIQPTQQLIRGRAMEAPSGFVQKRADDYKDMKGKVGESSVKASKKVNTMNNSVEYDNVEKLDVALDYKAQNGQVTNLASDIKNVRGRAFYNNNNTWTDALVQSNTKAKKVRIKFGSEPYYALLNNEPEAKDYLSLGRNVNFVMKGTLYEVYDGS